jgi:23S rRNA (adenine2503-C2)-methyltransferase
VVVEHYVPSQIDWNTKVLELKAVNTAKLHDINFELFKGEILGFYGLVGSRITVSTVGIPQAMDRFTDEYPDVHLALSLHSANQEVRQRMMPQARKYPLDLIRETLVKASAHGKVMIEYLMLAGVNDREEDLLALEDYLKGIPVHINLIPFNEYAGSNLRGTPEPERKVFGDRLKKAGFNVTLRYSLGSDIAAACGQLVQHKQKESLV